jgi:hypothetical protein
MNKDILNLSITIRLSSPPIMSALRAPLQSVLTTTGTKRIVPLTPLLEASIPLPLDTTSVYK